MSGADEKARVALDAFMRERGLKPHPWAKKAGLRSSTLYNYLSGRSHSLSSQSLQRLAKAANATVDEILTGNAKQAAPTAPTSGGGVAVSYRVGVYGRLFPMDVEVISRPVGIPAGVRVVAAKVDGDGLHPVPADWHVFFEEESKPAEALIGKLAVVRLRGNPQPMIREIRRGSTAGLYTLLSWGAGPIDDAEIVEAHLILSISQV